MEIIAKSREMNAKDLYRMTRNAKIQKMSDAANSTIKVDAWVHYQDENSSGKVQDIISIAEKETGMVYATNSPTFVREFLAIVKILEEAGETLDELEVISGTSKGGRTFITCGL